MQKQTNSLAIVSLILGILGLIQFLPLIGSLAAIILGHIARGQIARSEEQTGSELAMGGLVTGYLGLAISCAGTFLIFAIYGSIIMAAIMAFVGGAASGM